MSQYVKNADLRKEIIKCKESGVLSTEAILMFKKMCERYSLKYKYKHEEDREECISFAVMDCYLYWNGYNPDRSDNAFAYYTAIINNAFSKAWRKLYGKFPSSKKVSLSSNQIFTL